MERIKSFVLKHKITTGVFFIIIVPAIINASYLLGMHIPLLKTMWGASDLLSYYGTILGATAAIIAVTWTIFETRNKTKDDWNNQISLNNRNLMVKYATELIDAINYQNVTNEFSKIILDKDKQITIQEIEILKERLMYIIVNSNSAITKYKIFEDENNLEYFEQLEGFLTDYQSDLLKLYNLLEVTKVNVSNINANPDDINDAKEVWAKIESAKISVELRKFAEKYNGNYKGMFELVKKAIPEVKNHEKEIDSGQDNQDQ